MGQIGGSYFIYFHTLDEDTLDLLLLMRKLKWEIEKYNFFYYYK